MLTEQQVLTALRQVMDPDLHRDIVTLGFVKDLRVAEGDVGFTIVLTTPACPVKDRLKEQAEQVVQALPGVRRVAVEMKAEVRPSPAAPAWTCFPASATLCRSARAKEASASPRSRRTSPWRSRRPGRASA